MNSCSPSVLALLAQADLLSLVAQAFKPPRDSMNPRLAIDEQQLADLLMAAGMPDDVGRAIDQLVQAAAMTPHEDVLAEHHRLFEGRMVCPANESAFVRRDKGTILADACGFYRAFGFEPSHSTGEKADHLLCQTELVVVLLVKLAQAEQAGLNEQAAVTTEALVAFASEHPGLWLGSFCNHLQAATALSFYQNAAAALRHLWQALSAMHGWPIASAAHEPAVDPGDPYECGMAPSSGEVELQIGGKPATEV